jgi:hypothetical protein
MKRPVDRYAHDGMFTSFTTGMSWSRAQPATVLGRLRSSHPVALKANFQVLFPTESIFPATRFLVV